MRESVRFSQNGDLYNDIHLIPFVQPSSYSRDDLRYLVIRFAASACTLRRNRVPYRSPSEHTSANNNKVLTRPGFFLGDGTEGAPASAQRGRRRSLRGARSDAAVSR